MTCPRCGRAAESVRTCPTCGQGKAIRPWIACASRTLSWGVALVALRSLFAGALLARLAEWGFHFVFGRTLGSFVASTFSVVVTLGTAALLSEAALGGRVRVFGLYVGFLGRLAGWFCKTTVGAVQLIYRAVEGGSASPPKKKKREAGDSGH